MKRTASEALIPRPSPYHSSVTLFEPSTVPVSPEPYDVPSPQRSKRARKLEDSTLTTDTIIDVKEIIAVAGPSKSPSKSPSKKRASTASPRKPKAVKQELETPHPAPEHWEETYSTIKALRARFTAPVDTMGCDQAQIAETDPKNRRFSILISLMLSSQTKDEVTDAAVASLRAAIGGTLSVDALISADESVIQAAINKVGFWKRKSEYIKKAAERLRDDFASDVPKTIDELCSLPGVGPKMGFLTLQIAWQLNTGIGVDVHVHRITNRLGWHSKATKTPEETRLNLQSWLPKKLHPEINHMLVGFGQIICTPVGPRCNLCTLPEKGLCPSAQVSSATASKNRKAVVMTPLESRPKLEIEIDVDVDAAVASGSMLVVKPESP